MHGIAEKVRLFLLVFLLAAPFGTAYCQMSDEAVVKYALEGRQSGKSDQQIGKELLARGVTPEQAAVRHWQERYGVLPYVVTHDVLKCQVPRTVAREESMALTLEQ